MRNYQQEMERIIDGLGGRRPKLLLHACCAPCTSSVLERLAPHFDVTIFYYNPNIWPEEEYCKRLEQFPKLLAGCGLADTVRVVDGGYEPERFLEISRGFEGEREGGARCPGCFELRMGETARRAKEGGYEFFASTLTVSPHKSAPGVNAAGEEAGERQGVRWLPSDFKKKDGYLRSIRLSEEYGLYRQGWCGCRFALEKMGGAQMGSGNM